MDCTYKARGKKEISERTYKDAIAIYEKLNPEAFKQEIDEIKAKLLIVA